VVDEIVNGAVTRQYTYGLQRISQNLSPAVTGSSTWTPSFYMYDGGGSVRKLTNSLAVVTDEYEYDAFGNSFTKVGTTPNNYLYRGEQYDSDLGLYYLRARYYNPATGRFLSRDPEDGYSRDPKTLHKYLYAGGDPVNAEDPTGRAEMVEVSINLGKISLRDFAALVMFSGALDCIYEFSLTKITGAIEAAWDGGTITQVGPCVWLFVNTQKAVASAQPIAGTRISPWTPQCDQLKAAVNAARSVANGLGKCSAGMSPWQLQVRYDAWIAFGATRAQYNMVCWNGGDQGHQEADANAWLAAGKCAMLKMAFQ
jgi:RHS repeat-associated protein